MLEALMYAGIAYIAYSIMGFEVFIVVALAYIAYKLNGGEE